MKICNTCKISKPIAEYHLGKSFKDGVQNTCKQCQSLYRKTRYIINKVDENTKAVAWQRERSIINTDQLRQYLEDKYCLDCSTKDFQVLEFDHVRGVKQRNISQMMRNYKWDSILLEIAKCDVVCANCHRRRTAIRGNHRRSNWIK